jgi:hypothetical protein
MELADASPVQCVMMFLGDGVTYECTTPWYPASGSGRRHISGEQYESVGTKLYPWGLSRWAGQPPPCLGDCIDAVTHQQHKRPDGPLSGRTVVGRGCADELPSFPAGLQQAARVCPICA